MNSAELRHHVHLGTRRAMRLVQQPFSQDTAALGKLVLPPRTDKRFRL